MDTKMPVGKRVMMRGTPLVEREALLFLLSFSEMSFGLWRFGEDFFFIIFFFFIFSELVVKGNHRKLWRLNYNGRPYIVRTQPALTYNGVVKYAVHGQGARHSECFVCSMA